jgi:hypothetical protein
VAKQLLYAMVPREPFPEYQNPLGAPWKLMSAILRRLKQKAGDRPMVIVPMVYSGYVRYRMSRRYWERYSSLASDPGVHAIDMVPHFRRIDAGAARCFQEPHDIHFSDYGHSALADFLKTELTRIGLLPAPRMACVRRCLSRSRP